MRIQRPGFSTQLLVVAIIIFLMLPLLAVIPISFTAKSYLSMPNGHWSFKHYEALFTSAEWLTSIGYSLLIGIIASVIATALATSFALGVWYLRSRWVTVLVAIALLPMAVPPVISAVSLFFLETNINAVIPWLGYDTVGGVIIAHVIMIVPYGVVVVLVTLSKFDRRIEAAARSSGATLMQSVFYIVLPNIRVGIVSSLLLTFVLSWEEIAVTLFVTSVNVITLPRRIWTSLRSAIDPKVAAISVVLIAIAVIVVLGRTVVPIIYRYLQQSRTGRAEEQG